MKIRYIFLNVDMRKSQVGLKSLLEGEKLKLKRLDFSLFLNNKQTQLKLLSWDYTMCISYKSQSGKINPLMLKSLHNYWDGKSIDWKKAEYDALVKSLSMKNKRVRIDKDND